MSMIVEHSSINISWWIGQVEHHCKSITHRMNSLTNNSTETTYIYAEIGLVIYRNHIALKCYGQ